MPGLVEGRCGPEARPGEPEPTAGRGSEPARPDLWNVSLWRDLDLPQESDFLHTQGSLLGEQRTDELSFLRSDAGLVLWARQGMPAKCGCPLALGIIHEDLSPLDRGPPLNIWYLSVNNHGGTLESESQVRRTGAKPGPSHTDLRSCHLCITHQRRLGENTGSGCALTETHSFPLCSRLFWVTRTRWALL